MRWALPRRRHRYAERTGMSVSIITMHRVVEKLNLRCKKSQRWIGRDFSSFGRKIPDIVSKGKYKFL